MRLLLLGLVLVAACRSAPAPAPADEPVTRPISQRPTDGCAALTEDTCNSLPDCHAEFGWPLECRGNNCKPLGFQYVACHKGEKANCEKSSPNCDEPDPPCAAQGNYRVLWLSGCHEGCVRAEDCAPAS